MSQNGQPLMLLEKVCITNCEKNQNNENENNEHNAVVLVSTGETIVKAHIQPCFEFHVHL